MQAAAHGPDPEVVRLYESPSAGEVHILTTNQGVFASISGAYKWVCEDAVVPSARTQGLLIDGADPSRWLVATSKGIFSLMMPVATSNPYRTLSVRAGCLPSCH